MSRPTNRQIETWMERMADRVPDMLEELLGPGRNVCVLATRIAGHVFAELGVPARPLPVKLMVLNAEMQERTSAIGQLQPPSEEAAEEWRRAGAKSILIGYGSPDPVLAPRRFRGYDGHLVCVVREKWLLDLTLDQANRPADGIKVEASCVISPPRALLRGTMPPHTSAAFHINGATVHYFVGTNQSFYTGQDWRGVGRHHELVKRALALTTRR